MQKFRYIIGFLLPLGLFAQQKTDSVKVVNL